MKVRSFENEDNIRKKNCCRDAGSGHGAGNIFAHGDVWGGNEEKLLHQNKPAAELRDHLWAGWEGQVHRSGESHGLFHRRKQCYTEGQIQAGQQIPLAWTVRKGVWAVLQQNHGSCAVPFGVLQCYGSQQAELQCIQWAGGNGIPWLCALVCCRCKVDLR